MKFLFMKNDFSPSYASISKNMCLAFVTGYISFLFLATIPPRIRPATKKIIEEDNIA